MDPQARYVLPNPSILAGCQQPDSTFGGSLGEEFGFITSGAALLRQRQKRDCP